MWKEIQRSDSWNQQSTFIGVHALHFERGCFSWRSGFNQGLPVNTCCNRTATRRNCTRWRVCWQYGQLQGERPVCGQLMRNYILAMRFPVIQTSHSALRQGEGEALLVAIHRLVQVLLKQVVFWSWLVWIYRHGCKNRQWIFCRKCQIYGKLLMRTKNCAFDRQVLTMQTQCSGEISHTLM